MLGNATPRTFLQKKVDNHWLSFAIDRVTVLKAVMKHIPELLPFKRAAYARLGRSVWGRRGAGPQPWRVIMSRNGVRQGRRDRKNVDVAKC